MTNDWQIFKGNNEVNQKWIKEGSKLPAPPSWRDFNNSESDPKKRRAETFQARPEEVELVNAALYLRRPLLVTGKPGTGKTSLAYAVAYELGLGEVLHWPITTRTTLKDGLYNYDAIGRLQDAKEKDNVDKLGKYLNLGLLDEAIQHLQDVKDKKSKDNLADIGKYINLGSLGTALLPSDKPRVLLIDEIDKSDIDLPNDLLHIFEEGEFEIPELRRIADKLDQVEVQTADKDGKATIKQGRVRCTSFPFVILTSNGERDFPPPFLRRCIRLDIQEPNQEELERIVKAHLQLDDKLSKEANYDGNYTYCNGVKGVYRGETTEVGSFQVANEFGLYDMHGNVWEWCEDDWHNNYENAPADGSAWISGESNNNKKVLRGGSWLYFPDYCRSARRFSYVAGFDGNDLGFRVVCGAAWTL